MRAKSLLRVKNVSAGPKPSYLALYQVCQHFFLSKCKFIETKTVLVWQREIKNIENK